MRRQGTGIISEPMGGGSFRLERACPCHGCVWWWVGPWGGHGLVVADWWSGSHGGSTVTPSPESWKLSLPVAAFPEGAEKATRLSARLGRSAAGPKCLDAFDAIIAMATAEVRVEATLADRHAIGAWGTTADNAAPLRWMLLTSTETRDEDIIIAITN